MVYGSPGRNGLSVATAVVWACVQDSESVAVLWPVVPSVLVLILKQNSVSLLNVHVSFITYIEY